MSKKPEKPKKEIIQISGIFQRIVFMKPGKEGVTPFIIGHLEVDNKRWSFKGHADPAEFLREVCYTFQGYYEKHPQYGDTVRFHSWKAEAPHSRHGLIGYLKRHCDGIGSRRATELYDAFGQEAVKILREDPERVHRELRGAVKLEVIRANSEKLKGMAQEEGARIEVEELLAGRSFAKVAPEECIQLWGLNAAENIKTNPFTLMMAGISGAGFARCDELYVDLGHDPVAIIRQVFCLQYALMSDKGGNTWIPWERALHGLNKLISSARVDGKRALLESERMGYVKSRKEGGQLWLAEARHAVDEKIVAVKVRLLLARGVGEMSTGIPESSTTALTVRECSMTTPTKGGTSTTRCDASSD